MDEPDYSIINSLENVYNIYCEQKKEVADLIKKRTANKKHTKIYNTDIARITKISPLTVERIVDELIKDGDVKVLDENKIFEERRAQKKYPCDLDVGDIVIHSSCYEKDTCQYIGEKFEVTRIGWYTGSFDAKKVNETDKGALKEMKWEKKHCGHEGIYAFSRNQVRKDKKLSKST